MKNSLEVTNSSIKQTQMTSANGYRGDECLNHAYAETKSSESKRTSRLVRNLTWTGRTRRRAKHRDETTKAKIETKKGSEKKHLHEGKAQGQVESHHEEVQDCELRGQGNFEWNTDLIETKKLENHTCQVAQDLYSGEAQHEL